MGLLLTVMLFFDLEYYRQALIHTWCSCLIRLHIRRTDKLTSAGNNTFHAVEEYMVLAEKWYEEIEKRYPRVPRRVFLATDDPSTKQEINIK